MGICQSSQRKEIQNLIKYQLDRNPSKVNSRLKLIQQFEIYTYQDLLSDQNRDQFKFEQWEFEILLKKSEEKLNQRYGQAGSNTEQLKNYFDNFNQKIIHLLFGEDELEKQKLIINFLNLVKKVEYTDKNRYTMESNKQENEIEGSSSIVVFNIYEVDNHIFFSIETPPLKSELDCYYFRSIIYNYFQQQKVEAVYNVIFVTPVRSQSVNDNERRLIQSIFEIFKCKDQIQFFHIILTHYDGGEKVDTCITSKQSVCYQFLHNLDQQQQIFFCNNNRHQIHDLSKKHYEDLKLTWKCLRCDHGQALIRNNQEFRERKQLIKILQDDFVKLKLLNTNISHIRKDLSQLRNIFDKEWKHTAFESPYLLSHNIIFSENNIEISCKSLIIEPLPNDVPQYIRNIIESTKNPNKVEEMKKNIDNEQKQFQIDQQNILNDIKYAWELKSFYDCFLEEYENQEKKYNESINAYLNLRKQYYQSTFWPQDQVTIQDIEKELIQ